MELNPVIRRIAIAREKENKRWWNISPRALGSHFAQKADSRTHPTFHTEHPKIRYLKFLISIANLSPYCYNTDRFNPYLV
jgi:hypothetical protein